MKRVTVDWIVSGANLQIPGALTITNKTIYDCN